MKWPFKRTEARSYDPLTGGGALDYYEGVGVPDGSRTAVTELALGLYSGAMARCTVSPAISAITPTFLAEAARAVVRRGEAVYALDVMDGMLELLPTSEHEVTGGVSRETWSYWVTMAAPSRIEIGYRPAAGVLHLTYATDPARPWRGVGPLQTATHSAQLEVAPEI